ncbi:MAG: hypothetical protein JSV16_07670, partial [Candidatus Hydrogenedentota bacterium]
AAAAVGKATWAFANEFARYYASSNAERMLVQQAGQGKLSYSVIEPAITRASAAFVTTLISDTLGAGLDALFEKSETINTKVGKYILNQITKIFTTHWINGLIMAVAQARADYLQGKAKSVSAALPGHLVAHFSNLFTNEVKGAATWLAKAG